MATDKKTVSFKTDSSQKQRIVDFKDRNGYEHLSEAVEDLVDVGLREQKSPIVYRLKDRVVDWASALALAAVIVVVGGATTKVVAMSHAVAFSVVLLMFAVMLLGMYELTRVSVGANEIGAALRDRFGREKA